MEAAQFALVQQESHDLFDIDPAGMVAEVHQDLGPLSQFQRPGVSCTPIGDIGGIKGRLEEFILDQHASTGGQLLVYLGQAAFEAPLAGPQIVLPGVIGAIRKPQAEEIAAHLVHDLAAFQEMIDGQFAGPGMGVPQGAQAVFIILKDVGINRPNTDALLFSILAEGRVIAILGHIPGDMDGDRRGDPRHLVDHSGVVDLLPGGAGRAGPGEILETRPGIGIPPGGGLDLLGL